mmetsp:Transcript_59464/g.192285  ORF Transcript_59464/g.192285 Transcript_59464/m.192285 type:complete len:149 (-) Transcript_59464:52-498(-)
MSLDNKLKHVGSDARMTALVDLCVNTTIGQDLYSVCFFGSARQGSVNLGSYDRWDAEDPAVMLFSQGQRCWDGPARSLRLRVVCGSEPVLLNLGEPSRCSYEATATHWSICSESDVESARGRLALLESNGGHSSGGDAGSGASSRAEL